MVQSKSLKAFIDWVDSWMEWMSYTVDICTCSPSAVSFLEVLSSHCWISTISLLKVKGGKFHKISVRTLTLGITVPELSYMLSFSLLLQALPFFTALKGLP